MGKIKQYHHHFHFSYTTSIKRHLSSLGIVIAISILIVVVTLQFAIPRSSFNVEQISIADIMIATLNTFIRLLIGYTLSLIVSIPLALTITSSSNREKVLLPIFDIIQSIPVLAFFPVIVVFFTKYQVFELAAIFILFMSMVWNLVFTMIGGLKTIPQDVQSAAQIFKFRGLNKLWHITLPAIFPYIVTGSLLGWAQGWSIIIVAEVLHTYIPHGTMSQDLLGLGSLLVNSFTQGKNSLFLTTLSVMILCISLMNFFVWQRLLHITQRFKFD